MSISADGRRVICDGLGCSSTAAVPIALHQTLGFASSQTEEAKGWLFVTGKKGYRHFCTRCSGRYLAFISSEPIGTALEEKEAEALVP